MSMTQAQFWAAVQNYLDSTGTDASSAATIDSLRWDHTTISAVGDNVFGEEWSNILDTNQVYRFQNITNLTTDSNGQIALTSLTTGSGDTAKNFYRVLSGFSDGTVLYRQTDYRNVPLGTVTNYQSPWDYLFYLAGQNFQFLPVASGTVLQTWVSWTPTTISALATSSSVIDFPSPYVLVWQTAGKLLLKGGAQSGAAQTMFQLAEDARQNMLGSIARLTTRPDFLQFTDTAANWGGL